MSRQSTDLLRSTLSEKRTFATSVELLPIFCEFVRTENDTDIQFKETGKSDFGYASYSYSQIYS